MRMQNATGLAYNMQRKSTFKDTVSWNSIIVYAITDKRVTKNTRTVDDINPLWWRKSHIVSATLTPTSCTCKSMLCSLLRDKKTHFMEVPIPGQVPSLRPPGPPVSRRPFGREFFIASCNGAISAGHRLTVSRRGSRRSETLLLGRQWTLDSDEWAWPMTPWRTSRWRVRTPGRHDTAKPGMCASADAAIHFPAVSAVVHWRCQITTNSGIAAALCVCTCP